MRDYHERLILRWLRRKGGASKAELARFAGMTGNAAGQIIKSLQERDLVRSAGKRHGGRGQPAEIMQLHPQGAYSIGIKVGRRAIETLLLDFSGDVQLHRIHEQPFPLPDEALRIVLDDIAALTNALDSDQQSRLSGIGLAIPYHLGSWQKELGMPEASRLAWRHFDMAGQIRAHTTLPVVTENDGTSAAVGELFYGVGRECDDFLYVYIGTATGGGVIIDGDYRTGVHHNAGDIGLILSGPSLLPHLLPHPTKSHPVLARASLSALINHLGHHGYTNLTLDRLDLDHGPLRDLADVWLKDAADALAPALFNTHRLIDVERIVIDGNLPGTLLQTLVSRTEALMIGLAPESCSTPQLQLGRIGSMAGALGAGILPFHLNFHPSPHILVGAI